MMIGLKLWKFTTWDRKISMGPVLGSAGMLLGRKTFLVVFKIAEERLNYV